MNHATPRRSAIFVMHSDALVCAGLSAALRQHAGFDTFVDGCDDTNWDLPQIDVIITDYDNAMRLASSVGRALDTMAAARTLIVTTNDRETDIRRAIEAGIHGYVLLGGPLSELIEGVTAVANGLRYLSRSVAQRIAESLTHTSLTSREIQVLSLVAAGECNKAIARELRIEMRTVKSHMTSIMSKLAATSRTQAASIGATRGLVEPNAALRRTSAQRQARSIMASAQHGQT
jgi:DNA-binding NarL/FixJ family response regulator